MKGIVILAMLLLAGQALASGVYTGSDGKEVAFGGLPKIAVVDGKISESGFAAVLEANFNASAKTASSSKKIGLPTLNEFEQLVETLSASAEGKALAEIARQEAAKLGWPVRIGQKDGDYYAVTVVNRSGSAVAAQIICNSQLMLSSTGPDKAMEIVE